MNLDFSITVKIRITMKFEIRNRNLEQIALCLLSSTTKKQNDSCLRFRQEKENKRKNQETTTRRLKERIVHLCRRRS